MSKHCQLIVYEPHKSPKTVDLYINPEDIENIYYPVFNEDGSILKDYNIVVEDSDTDDITKCSMGKKREREADVFSPSIENSTHASKCVQNFLSEYKMNSSKKEKRIARVKQIRQKIAMKKLKNKLRKEKNRMVKEMLCSENSHLDHFPNIGMERNGQDAEKPRWNFNRANGLVDSRGFIRNDYGVLNKTDSSIATLVERTFKPKKRKRKRKKNGIGIANTQVQGDTCLQSQKSEISPQLDAPLTPAPCDPNIEKSKPATTKSKETTSDSITANASSFNKPLFRNSPKKWKASESAPDFIPINTNSSRKLPPMSRSEREYAKFISRLNLPNNEYMGISQKAYFLQY